MNAPNKIYLHPDIGGREFIRPWLHRAANSESVAYIRKDALLKWVKDKLSYEQGFDDGGAEHGYRTALKDLIEKLNSI